MTPEEQKNLNSEPFSPENPTLNELQPLNTDPNPVPVPPQTPVQPQEQYGSSQQATAQTPNNQSQPAYDHPLFNQPVPSSSPPKKKASKLKIFLIIMAGLILLTGVTAAGYFGVYLPNKPENVLKQSIANTLNKRQISGQGAATASGGGSSGAMTLDYTFQLDGTNSSANAGGELAFSGVKLPFEARFIDENAYLKINDLSTVKSLAKGFMGPKSGPLIDQASEKISNNWIEFDKSLLHSTECPVLSAEDFRLGEKDVEQVLGAYKVNEFASIKSTSEETFGDQEVTKFDLQLDQDKAESFWEEVEKIEAGKYPKACEDRFKDAGLQGDDEDKNKEDSYELSVWVNKSKKEVAKLVYKTESKTDGSIAIDFIFDDKPVNIQKPADSVPVLQLLGELTQLLGENPEDYTGENLNLGDGIFNIKT
jgi:hypothetical protein